MINYSLTYSSFSFSNVLFLTLFSGHLHKCTTLLLCSKISESLFIREYNPTMNTHETPRYSFSNYDQVCAAVKA